MKPKSELLKFTLANLKPVPKIDCAEFAQKHFVLPTTSAEPGRYNLSRTPYAEEILKAFTQPHIKKVVVMSSSQVGKALDINTPIPTVDGFKLMRDINVGDKLFDEQGNICNVTFVTETMYNRKCYEVEFSDGSKIIADAEHNWQVIDNGQSKVIPTTKLSQNHYIKRVDRDFYIKSVIEVPTRPVKCISVDSPNHLYLAGRAMIPTHNTTILLSVLARFIAVDPCNILLVLPTLELAQDISKDRIDSMIRDCPILTPLFYDDKKKSRDKNQTMLSKFFKGGRLVLVGANSPTGLSSRPIRLLLCDEVDRFNSSAGSEGDPIKLAETRQATYWNKVTGLFSTPTIEDISRIESEYKAGTMEEWQYKCPNCGEYHSINYEDITINYRYRCPDCGNEYDEFVMKQAPQKYVAHREAEGVRSFWLNAFSSPWMSWREIMREYEESKGDPEREQTVFNTKFGRTYRPVGAFDSEDIFLKRLEKYDAEVPSAVKVLVAAVDVQDNRLEYEICGFDDNEECYGIQKGVVYGMPEMPQTWDKLDTYLDKPYQKVNGEITVSRVFIDSGGHFTSDVYKYCYRARLKGRVAIKGLGQSGIKLLHKISVVKENGIPLQILGVNEGKQQVMNRLSIEEPGRFYFHFPQEDYRLETPRGYDRRYFKGLISERKVYRKSGGQMIETWESMYKRNEPLDLRCYAIAAYESLGKFSQSRDVKKVSKKIRRSSSMDIY